MAYLQGSNGWTGLGALNCPGDPGCPGYVVPGSVDWQNSMLQAILGNQNTPAAVDPGMSVTPASPSFSSWLNANATTVALGAAGFVVLVLFVRGGR